jgi:tetratricopeptide (TPR) repeat protein
VHEDSPFGFAVDLADPKWRRWTAAGVGWPMAAFAAQYMATRDRWQGTFVVVPLLLPPGFTSEAAIVGFANLVKGAPRLEAWANDSYAGYETSYEDSAMPGMPFTSVVRFIVAESAVYMLVGAASSGNAEALTATKAALDAVTLVPPRSVAQLDKVQRAYYGQVLALVGSGLSVQGRYADGVAALEAAREYGPWTEAVSATMAMAQFRLGDYAAARDEIGRYPGDLTKNPSLLSWRAASHAQLDETEAALRDYSAAFAGGMRDDDTVSAYVNLLVDVGRVQEAAAFLESYAAAGLTPDVIALQAFVSFRAGDEAAVEVAMVRLADSSISTPEAALTGGLIRYAQGDLGEFAAFVTRLEAAGLVSAEIYALLASGLIEQKRLQEARTVIANGLAFAPSSEELQALERVVKSGESAL